VGQLLTSNLHFITTIYQWLATPVHINCGPFSRRLWGQRQSQAVKGSQRMRFSPGACVLGPCASGPVPRVACHSESPSPKPKLNPHPSPNRSHQHPETHRAPVGIGASRRVDALADERYRCEHCVYVVCAVRAIGSCCVCEMS